MLACLLLVSCEGATYLNHHLTNHTADTLQVGYRSDESASGWQVDTVWTLAPGETHVHYAVDFWGKCHDCTPYEVLPYGLDSLWAANRTLTVELLDSALWEVHVDEGLSWIRFDQQLDLVPSHFE
ncbi:MAG: hypothetical protein CMC99_01955 [Flavobacteriales bacterium]|nr:hypothetical protein [Flavobacteriales bacterium]